MTVEGIFSTPTALFDLYHLLVEVIFGNIGVSIIGVGFVLMFILLICRTSMIFFVLWMSFYFGVMGTLYLGGFAMVLIVMIGFTFLMISIIRLWFREGAV